MGRLAQLLKYYHKCQKDVILTKWRHEVDQDDSVTQWMHNFYNYLLSNWHTQQKWCHLVFDEDTTSTTVDIYIDVLSSLEPSLNECIDAALKQTDDKLALLVEIKQMTKQFADNMIDIVGSKNDNLIFLQAIYSHLVTYTHKYAAYEQAFLMKKLSSVNCMRDELAETIQALGLSIPQIIDFAKEAKKRCVELTENCGYCGLLIALRSFLMSYADQFRVALRQIDRLVTLTDQCDFI